VRVERRVVHDLLLGQRVRLQLLVKLLAIPGVNVMKLVKNRNIETNLLPTQKNNHDNFSN
jgi:hypothetical protein